MSTPVAAAAAVLVAGAAAAAALAADASGAEPAPDVRINGRTVDASEPLTLRPGDRLETGLVAATVRAAGGGDLRVWPASALRHDGTDRGVESYFAIRGTVEGDVGPGTILGAAAAWATAPDAAAGRVRLEVAPSGAQGADPRSKGSATFQSLAGPVWLRFHAAATWLPPGCAATLTPSEGGPGSLSCAAGAENREPVELTRATGDRTHAASLPAGTTAWLSDRAGSTRFECRAAPEGRVVRLEVRRGARVTRSAALGPGAAALLAGDDLTLDIPALPEGVLASLIALDREFATLGAR